MIPELNPNLIYNFREKVHDHNDLIRLYFADYRAKNSIEGKDIWSKICSCMDWLTVAVEGIEIPKKKKSMNLASLEFTHFLVTIDMIVEAVNHLWVAIGQATNVKRPYINDRSIFQAKVFDREYTDEKYVKELRSWFGIHEVNGNEVDLEGFNKGVRFFSSWSSTLQDGEFSIRLYSNNSKAEEKYGGTKKVRVDSLINFVTLRYNTLRLLMDEINKLYFKEKRRLQKIPVNYDTNESELNQLKQVYQQAKDRKLTSEFYECEISQYISFLTCDLNDFQKAEKEFVTLYLSDLKSIIPIYQKVIQEVEWGEYKVFKLLNMNSQIYVNNHYDYSKVLEYAGGSSNSYSGEISLRMLIEKGLLPWYSSNLRGPSLSLLIHALDHERNKTNPRKIKKKHNLVQIIDDISDPPVTITIRNSRKD
jgi:hypothetical protein